MYAVDDRDAVVLLHDLPQSCVGAPRPWVVCDEDTFQLAYLIEQGPAPDYSSASEPIAVVTFTGHRAMMFGPPNDEALTGHPLASRGLEPYSASEVKHSSWIRALERMNSVHPMHRPDTYAGLRHFVFTFHDSTVECVAEIYRVDRHDASVDEVFELMKKALLPL